MESRFTEEETVSPHPGQSMVYLLTQVASPANTRTGLGIASASGASVKRRLRSCDNER